MFVARLVCSDPACGAEHEVCAPTVAELTTLSCECGWGLEMVAWPDWEHDLAPVIALPRRADLPHAA
jgi:hypothetical protein